MKDRRWAEGSHRIPGRGGRAAGLESRASWLGAWLPPCLPAWQIGAPAGSKTQMESMSAYLERWVCRSPASPIMLPGLIGAREGVVGMIQPSCSVKRLPHRLDA